ncbi:MAG: hypothetical protein RL215_3194 [Planctomycetota bacterium]
MNPIAASGGAGDDAVEEDDVFVAFADGDVPVGGLFEGGGEVGEFVVVGGEHGPAAGFVVEEFCDGPGEGDPIIGAGTASDFVEDDEAAGGGCVEDAGGFCHFDHEGTLTASQFITGTDSREDAISNPDSGGSCGDEGADLGHDGDESGLSDVSAFTGHIGAGDDLDSSGAWIILSIGRDSEPYVVGDELSGGEEAIEDGMSAVADIEDGGVFESGSAVASVGGDGGKAGEGIDFGERFCGSEEFAYGLCDEIAELVEEFEFECECAVFGAEDFVFVFLEFGGDEAFLVFECLFADVVRGDFVDICSGDFEVVAEDFVEADFEAVDTGAFDFASLVGGHPLSSAAHEVAEFVEFGIEAGANDAAVGDSWGWIFNEGGGDGVVDFGAEFDGVFEFLESGGGALCEAVAEWGEEFECASEADEIAWAAASGGDAGG